MTKVIGISGVSGSGKTAISSALSEKLPDVFVVHWDAYDDLAENPTIPPADYVEWYLRGADYKEWKTDSLENTLRSLKNGQRLICPVTQKLVEPLQFIVFDSGQGYHHCQTGQCIGLSIFLDTPLDVCLCRRLMRDFSKPEGVNCGNEMIEDISFYLLHSRPLFQLPYQNRKYDYSVDGSYSIESITSQIPRGELRSLK